MHFKNASRLCFKKVDFALKKQVDFATEKKSVVFTQNIFVLKLCFYLAFLCLLPCFFPFHFLGWEKEMATHYSILAWKIPWAEKPGRLQSVGSQRVGHDSATSL